AWVVWRRGNGFCGWAPLPPARRDRDILFEINALHPFCFNFCEERFLIDEHVWQHCEPVTRNVTFINTTTNITRFDRVGGRFINRGIAVNEVEKSVGRPVPRLAVADSRDPKSMQVTSSQVMVYRPRLPARTPTVQQGEARQAA